MDAVVTFIERWSKAEAAERANYQMFLCELCDVVEVPGPDPTGAELAASLVGLTATPAPQTIDRLLDGVKYPIHKL